MKQKVYISPSASRKLGYPNPYFPRLKQELGAWFDVMEADNRPCRMQAGALLKASLKADIFMLSFVETIAFQKLSVLQTCLALLAMDILRLRGGRLVFFFHNPAPHKGENLLSRILTKRMFRRACLVVAHSENTAAIARQRISADKVLLFPHPAELPEKVTPSERRADVLIWGTVLPYKGVLEFLSTPGVADSGLRIDVLGACPDASLARQIHALENGNVCFEERRAPMEEIAARIAASGMVLFPYLPGSISGSGTLMDTLRYGGSPVGPDVGAFHDLAQEGLCRVYKNPAELREILKSGWTVDSGLAARYLEKHSWPSFARELAERLIQRTSRS